MASGFVDLDNLTSGFQPSELIIVAARPSMGKTSFVLNVAQHVATKTDRTVGFFSLEMSKEQLFMRMLTAEAEVDSHRFRGGFLSERDYGNACRLRWDDWPRPASSSTMRREWACWRCGRRRGA